MVRIANSSEELVQYFEKAGYTWLFGLEFEFRATLKEGRQISPELKQLKQLAIDRLEIAKDWAKKHRTQDNHWELLQAIIDDFQKNELTPEEYFMLAVHGELGGIIREEHRNAWFDGNNCEIRTNPQIDGKPVSPKELHGHYKHICATLKRLGKQHGFDVTLAGHHLNASFWKWDENNQRWRNLNQLLRDPGSEPDPEALKAFQSNYGSEITPNLDPEATAISTFMMKGILQAAAEIAPLRRFLDPELSESLPGEAPAYVIVDVSSQRRSCYRMSSDHFEDRSCAEGGVNVDVMDAQLLTMLVGTSYALHHASSLKKPSPLQRSISIIIPNLFDFHSTPSHLLKNLLEACSPKPLDNNSIQFHCEEGAIQSHHQEALLQWFSKMPFDQRGAQDFLDYVREAINQLVLTNDQIDTSKVPEGPACLRQENGPSVREFFLEALRPLSCTSTYSIADECSKRVSKDPYSIVNSQIWSKILNKEFLQEWVARLTGEYHPSYLRVKPKESASPSVGRSA